MGKRFDDASGTLGFEQQCLMVRMPASDGDAVEGVGVRGKHDLG